MKAIEQALNDKVKLKARNKAYKITLQYCDETCNDVDNSFNEVTERLKASGLYSDVQMESIQFALSLLNMKVKDQGTRKIRHAFVNYVLEQQQGSK